MLPNYLSILCVLSYAAAAPVATCPEEAKRDVSPVPINIQYNGDNGAYLIDLQAGSGHVAASVDTGSSTWWVSSSKYQKGKSAKPLDKTVNLVYTSGQLTGQLYSDVANIGNLEIDEFPIASVDGATHYDALIGLGLPGAEFTVSASSYENGELVRDYTDTFLTQLKKSGSIATAAYSLWLNAPDNGNGQLLFGAIDTAKFSGTLGRLPLVNTPALDLTTFTSYQPGKPWQYTVNLNTVSLKNTKTDEQADIITGAHLPVLLDSGSVSSLASPKFVQALVDSLEKYKLSFNEQQGLWTSTSIPQGNLVLDFSGVSISVPFDDLFFPISKTWWGRTTYALSFYTNSQFTDVNDARSITILGQNILSSAYVVYDEEHSEVALAPAKRGNILGSSSIVEINGAVPSATQAPRYGETQVSGDYSVHNVATVF